MSPMGGGKGGAYLLVLSLRAPTRIAVGALGTIDFPEGTYAYAGSALAALEPRVRRHFSSEKRLHWHIDHLLARSRPVEALLLRSDEDLECTINEMVGRMEGAHPHAPGFGSSDCRCRTHLHRIDQRCLSSLEEFFPERLVPRPRSK